MNFGPYAWYMLLCHARWDTIHVRRFPANIERVHLLYTNRLPIDGTTRLNKILMTALLMEEDERGLTYKSLCLDLCNMTHANYRDLLPRT
jgi:hypothetical protein